MKRLFVVLAMLSIGSAGYGGRLTFSEVEETAIASLLSESWDHLRASRLDKLAELYSHEAIAGLRDVMAEGADIALEKGTFDQVQMIFGKDVKSGADVRKMETGTFFSRFIGFVINATPEMARALDGGTVTYLGSVRESESVGYAVARFTFVFEGEPIEVVEVSPLLRDAGGAWKFGMKAEFRALAMALKKR